MASLPLNLAQREAATGMVNKRYGTTGRHTQLRYSEVSVERSRCVRL